MWVIGIFLQSSWALPSRMRMFIPQRHLERHSRYPLLQTAESVTYALFWRPTCPFQYAPTRKVITDVASQLQDRPHSLTERQKIASKAVASTAAVLASLGEALPVPREPRHHASHSTNVQTAHLSVRPETTVHHNYRMLLYSCAKTIFLIVRSGCINPKDVHPTSCASINAIQTPRERSYKCPLRPDEFVCNSSW